MRSLTKLLLSLVLSLGVLPVLANNIKVENVTLANETPGSHTFVEFDLSWDNSWRLSSGPSNWDAAWVFVKYKVTGGSGCTAGDWQHATLSATSGDHLPNGNPVSIDAVSEQTGTFVYRNADGQGSNDWDALQLYWDYAADGLTTNCNVLVKVFAIEMVYIPEGQFFLGDGDGSNASTYAFTDSTSLDPFLVTSEGAITLGGGLDGSVGCSGNCSQGSGDWDEASSGAPSVTLPAAFPKGYQAFYCQKYEISQEQYAKYLNTLTANQQDHRWSTLGQPNGVGEFYNGNVIPINRNGISVKILPDLITPEAGEFANDLNNNGVWNEDGDGQDIACNRINWVDGVSYADWAGLRPMTEMEFEKVCRGPQVPILNEYAWGTPQVTSNEYTLSNSGLENELVNNPDGAVGNAALDDGASPTVDYSTGSATGANPDGPLRVGIFAVPTSSRIESGAGYYGVMNLSGNLGEVMVTAANPAGRSFTGLHGDGNITTDGLADVDFWPGINNNQNGGAASTAFSTDGVRACPEQFIKFSDQLERGRTSWRQYYEWMVGAEDDDRRDDTGFRVVRTAP